MNLSSLNKNMPGINSKTTWYGLGIVFLILIGFIIYSSTDVKITLKANELRIRGLYPVGIKYSEILQLEKVTSMPDVETKTGGFAFAGHFKGYFRLNGLGKTEIFVNVNTPPFIHLKLKDGEVFYLNYSDPQKTLELYSELQAKVAGDS